METDNGKTKEEVKIEVEKIRRSYDIK